MSPGILEGISVLEFGRMVAAPYCGKLLADLGADVVKLERPRQGDPARAAGPFPNDAPHPERSGLFKNDLSSIAINAGVPAASVDFGVANLRFTWYAGAFGVLTSTTAASDLDFSLAADPTFFDASNRLVGCAESPCGAPGFTPATWKITDSDGVLNNSTVFFNFIGTGSATLLVTGSIIEPGGGGYVNIITANQIPLPPAALLFGTALFGIGALRRWKDKKAMTATA